MGTRSQRSSQERTARSQAVQRVAEKPLLRGSLVVMHRTCGKKNCRCQQGKKHRALYLAIRSGDQRSMIYVPPALEETVRRWVETAQDLDRLLEVISQHCLQTLLQQKQETLARRRKARPKEQSP